jgi:hypothetical protein
MKRSTKIFLFLILVLTLAVPGTAFAKGMDADEVVFGGSYELRSGETLNGNLVMFGGNATLEEGSQVNGDIFSMGGNIQVAGEVNGGVVIFGGNVSLEDTAHVTGDVSAVGGNLDRAPGAQIDGRVDRDFRGPFPFALPFGGMRMRGVDTFSPLNFFVDILWFMFRTFMWAALAVLVMIFLPRNVERSAQAAVNAPLISGGVGLLTAVVAPLLLLVLAITIILIPVSLLGVILLVLAWAFGLISLGYEVGRRLAQALNQVWAPAVSAGVGTFVLVLVTNGVGKIPCVGWIVPALVGILGLGAAILSRFGTGSYPPAPQPYVAPRGDWPPAPVPPAAAAAATPPVVETVVAAEEADMIYPETPAEEEPRHYNVGVYPVPETGMDESTQELPRWDTDEEDRPPETVV